MYVSPEKGSFSRTLPPSYFEAIEQAINRYALDWLSKADAAYQKYFIDSYAYGRLDQMVDSVLPWMRAAIPEMKDLGVLEIGTGTGSSTAGLIGAVRQIYGFDIEAEPLGVAQTRCDHIRAFLGASTKVDLRDYDTSWIDGFYADPEGFFPERAEIAFAYALFEHLLPVERIKLLKALWRYLPVGGYLVTVELPNRLSTMDWHTTGLPFSDILPTEIYALFAMKSDRQIWPDIRAGSIEELDKVSRERQFRLGRGISFHEFYLALPAGSFEVVGSDTTPQAINRTLVPGYDPPYQALLAERLAAMIPPIDPAFAAPCLDLVIRKTA